MEVTTSFVVVTSSSCVNVFVRRMSSYRIGALAALSAGFKLAATSAVGPIGLRSLGRAAPTGRCTRRG